MTSRYFALDTLEIATMVINFVLRAQWRVDVSDDQVF